MKTTSTTIKAAPGAGVAEYVRWEDYQIMVDRCVQWQIAACEKNRENAELKREIAELKKMMEAP